MFPDSGGTSMVCKLLNHFLCGGREGKGRERREDLSEEGGIE